MLLSLEKKEYSFKKGMSGGKTKPVNKLLH